MLMFARVLSRRIPALFTSTSRPPKVSMAVSIRRFAPSQSDTSSVLATASPPSARTSSTTEAAGPRSAEPLPSRPAPRSLTTTFAPCLANSRAYSRPRPRPAPVITTTCPSHSLLIRPSLVEFFCMDLFPSTRPVAGKSLHERSVTLDFRRDMFGQGFAGSTDDFGPALLLVVRLVGIAIDGLQQFAFKLFRDRLWCVGTDSETGPDIQVEVRIATLGDGWHIREKGVA